MEIDKPRPALTRLILVLEQSQKHQADSSIRTVSDEEEKTIDLMTIIDLQMIIIFMLTGLLL